MPNLAARKTPPATDAVRRVARQLELLERRPARRGEILSVPVYLYGSQSVLLIRYTAIPESSKQRRRVPAGLQSSWLRESCSVVLRDLSGRAFAHYFGSTRRRMPSTPRFAFQICCRIFREGAFASFIPVYSHLSRERSAGSWTTWQGFRSILALLVSSIVLIAS